MYVLVAYGPNSVAVPCLVWSDKSAADSRCREILGDPCGFTDDGRPEWRVTRERRDRGSERTFLIIETAAERLAYQEFYDVFDTKPWPSEERARADRHKEREAALGNLRDRFKDAPRREVDTALIFTDYYGGCGEVGSFVLLEVADGTPFVGFNLD